MKNGDIMQSSRDAKKRASVGMFRDLSIKESFEYGN